MAWSNAVLIKKIFQQKVIQTCNRTHLRTFGPTTNVKLILKRAPISQSWEHFMFPTKYAFSYPPHFSNPVGPGTNDFARKTSISGLDAQNQLSGLRRDASVHSEALVRRRTGGRECTSRKVSDNLPTPPLIYLFFAEEQKKRERDPPSGHAHPS